MVKKVVKWNWDRETSRLLLSKLMEKAKEADKLSDGDYVIDIGGNTGSFARKNSGKKAICMDIMPKPKYHDVLYVKGDVRRMPFSEETFGLVLAKAVLHHVPKELESALGEIKRITMTGGYVVIEEPISKNPINNVAGKFFTTDIHDEDEQPFDPETLIVTLKKYFENMEIEYHLFTTYLIPHVIARAPKFLRPALRNLTRLLYELDRSLISKSKFLARRSSYITIVAKK